MPCTSDACERDGNKSEHHVSVSIGVVASVSIVVVVSVSVSVVVPPRFTDPWILNLSQLLCVPKEEEQQQSSSGAISAAAAAASFSVSVSFSVSAQGKFLLCGNVEMVAEMSTENSTHDRKLATSFVVFQTVANRVRPGSIFSFHITVCISNWPSSPSLPSSPSTPSDPFPTSSPRL